jgi:hypothetical protein
MDDYKNYAYSTLATGITIGATSCAVVSGTGSRFPSTAFDAVIWDASYPSATEAVLAGAGEQVRVTARSTDALTITRAQGGTTAVALNVSGRAYAIAQVLTESAFEALGTEVALKAPASNATLTGTTTTDAIKPDIANLGTVASGNVTLSTTKAVSRVVLSGASATVVFPAGDPRVSQSLIVDSTSGSDTTISMEESWSMVRDTLITSFVLPAGLSTVLTWVHDGTQYIVSGDRQTLAQAKAALNLTSADIPDLDTDLALLAPIASPTFTGIPAVPTADQAVNTTQAASTAYVRTAISAIGAGSGDVVGPVSSTDNAIARFNGTGGKTLQNGGPTINDSGEIEIYGDTIPGSLTLADADATAPETLVLTAPVDISASYVLIFPSAQGTAGQVLSIASVTGNKVTLQWSTP